MTVKLSIDEMNSHINGFGGCPCALIEHLDGDQPPSAINYAGNRFGSAPMAQNNVLMHHASKAHGAGLPANTA